MKISLIFLIFFCNEIILSQSFNYYKISNDTSNCRLKNILKNDTDLFLDDIFAEIKKPADFSSKDWITIGFIGGVTGLFISQDQAIKDIADKNHNNVSDKILSIGEFYGSAKGLTIIPAGFYLTGLLLNNEEIRRTGRILIESLLISGTIVQVIKILTSRARPYMGKGSYSFDPIKTNNNFNSFPSGHSVIAFTISSVLSERFNNIYASIGLYSLSSLTAYQRVYSNNHWFSDTFLAAVIGIVIGNSIAGLQNNDYEHGERENNPSFIPIINSKFTGLGLQYNF
jgi:hypothetical protein